MPKTMMVGSMVGMTNAATIACAARSNGGKLVRCKRFQKKKTEIKSGGNE